MITQNGPIRVSTQGEELWAHGTPAFPCGCYQSNLLTSEVPWHWHAELEFGLCLEGRIDYQAGTVRVVLNAGDAIFVNSNVPHTEVPAQGSEAPCREGSLVCRPSMLYGTEQSSIYLKYFSLLALPSAPQVVHLRADGEPWQQEAARAVFKAYHAVENDDTFADVIAREELTRVCLTVLEHAHNYAGAAPLPTGGQTMGRLQTMIAFIEEHYPEDLTVADIAAAANVSQREAQREFKESLGERPMEYLSNWRLYEASRLLRTTDEPISTIARVVGYASPSYFSRKFRERYGHTPAEHRTM